MKLNLDGQIAIVTGGTRGIGAAISRLLAINGASLRMIYRSDHAQAHQHLSQLPGVGHEVVHLDIADSQAVLAYFTQLEHPVDILINNAGIAFHHPVERTDYADWLTSWTRIMACNLLAVANIIHCVVPSMKANGGGRIISVSSRGAYRGEPLMPAYGASKAGLNSLTQSLAHALSRDDIFVAAVAPGFVNTEMAAERMKGDEGQQIKAQSPMNRVAEPEDVAQAVFSLLAAPMWSTGTIMDVNGASYFR